MCLVTKLAPEKFFFRIPKVKLIGHQIGYNTIKPVHSKRAAFQKLHSPTGKVVLMSFIGALNFYTKPVEKPISIPKRFDLLHENTPWNWSSGLELLFQQLKLLSLRIQNLQYQIQKIFLYNS